MGANVLNGAWQLLCRRVTVLLGYLITCLSLFSSFNPSAISLLPNQHPIQYEAPHLGGPGYWAPKPLPALPHPVHHHHHHHHNNNNSQELRNAPLPRLRNPRRLRPPRSPLLGRPSPRQHLPLADLPIPRPRHNSPLHTRNEPLQRLLLPHHKPNSHPRDSTTRPRRPHLSSSVRERFRHAGELIRQRTVLFGERLGRDTLDDGGDLGAALLPDDFDEALNHHHHNQPSRQDEEKGGLEESAAAQPLPSAEAHRLVRSVTQNHVRRRRPRSAYARSGQTTPEGALRPESWYGSGKFGGGGILAQLLRLQAAQGGSGTSSAPVSDAESDTESPVSSGAATPKKEKLKWYKKPSHQNQQSLTSLVGAGMNLSSATLPAPPEAFLTPKRGKKKAYRKTRLEDEIRVTVHIAEILARQRYIMQLCRALMRYGAPTHRMEEYMKMTARVLEVEGQFLYLPGCMIMSFDDPTTRTAEVKLVRVVQGVDLGRLADTHNVYKNVVHDLIGVEEAISELDQIMSRKPRFNKWLLVPAYGFASAAVGPFAFEARPIDMPIIFLLGSIVGLMQHVLAPKSVLYSNVFEVTAAVLTSFLARAFGSIPGTNGEKHLFCFSALSQSSIALILPGFMVLCSSLELQSHQIIAGSIRMVYAIIYSLFLGYGVTVGTTIYGLIDGAATSDKSCTNLDIYGSKYIQRFCFVPLFVVFVAIINQAKWKQLPAMIFIALSGYITNYFSTTKLGPNSEVANTVGAFTIGLLGNLYSRVWRGHAAAAILPAIFVLVPSGLASSGSLIAGLNYADSVRANLKNGTTENIASQDTSIASLGFGMVQIAIGITVGLFVSALVVYPLGKRRSGLFNF
ncbi:hypothetical protein ASPSYDRAFT_160566 [Aspergillus sydowii CBS 593.65]|uniref:Threonine/serine exporter-like N-terminal domain-containing protein n=1 Tax=Aspergillus sydowii CBS 593.65 TaxID=1036612 RepID=A0A1L9T5A7_9EURO|nr:uncharacterized protein ASPSYDRAFT_160566 [Aspergillus sydowii CBS 593.65]OJJ54585.1 hypothetical protein ASPSYDRAFT_160566 [Aspergillus sydowii CBS 593.65]